MRRRLSFLSFLLLCATGCTDSIDAMARDTRNMNNEAVDALMVVTNDAQAKIVIDRVFDNYQEKVKKIDDRLKNWDFRDSKEKANDLFLSDSLAILFVENVANRDRLLIEKTRLKELAAQQPDAANLAALARGEKTKTLEDELAKGGRLRDAAMRFATDTKLAGTFKELIERFNARMENTFAIPKAGGGKYFDVLKAAPQNQQNNMGMPGA
jgi:hypothetical protein